jgi:hypothetical protein
MDSIFIDRVIAHHKLALKVIYIAIGLSLLGLLFQGCSSLRLSGICVPLGNGVEYISYMTLAGGVLALFWLHWSLRSAERLPMLNASNPEGARAAYLKIWQWLEVFGILITIFAVVMMPLSIPTVMMGVPGLAADFAIYAGSWLYFRARKLNREIRENRSTESAGGEPAAGESSTSDDAKKSVLKQAGIIPLTAVSYTHLRAHETG